MRHLIVVATGNGRFGMQAFDTAKHGLEALADALADGKKTSANLVEECLERIERLDPGLGAFSAVFADRARAAASIADAERTAGHARGPLHGLPIAIKDIFDITGHPTTAGSKALTDRHPTKSAHAVERLEAAGMIVIGKTKMVEFAFGGWGTNPVQGTPKNPWGLPDHRAPGGSSSGSAVAVAASLVPAALGTDTGGSIRTPAVWCGIVGLKTSKGLIGRGGVVPLCPTHDTVGPMTRSVRDAALLLDVLSGLDPDDPVTRGAPEINTMATIEDGIEGFRFGVLSSATLGETDTDMLDAFDRAKRSITDLGGIIQQIEMPAAFDTYLSIGGDIMSFEAYWHLGRYVEANVDTVAPEIRDRILRGKAISVERYNELRTERSDAHAAFAERFEGFDALLLPGSHRMPPALDDVDENAPPNRFGRIINVLDLAALTVPTGLAPSGHPTGIQIAVRKFDDARALRIGRALEKAGTSAYVAPPTASTWCGASSPYLSAAPVVS